MIWLISLSITKIVSKAKLPNILRLKLGAEMTAEKREGAWKADPFDNSKDTDIEADFRILRRAVCERVAGRTGWAVFGLAASQGRVLAKWFSQPPWFLLVKHHHSSLVDKGHLTN